MPGRPFHFPGATNFDFAKKNSLATLGKRMRGSAPMGAIWPILHRLTVFSIFGSDLRLRLRKRGR